MPGRTPPHDSRLSWEGRVLLLAVLAGLPGTVISLVVLWSGDYTPKVQWTLSLVIGAVWWGALYALRERTVFPLQTLANLLEALREGDYSMRGRAAGQRGALVDVMAEVNSLSEILKSQRFDAVEATALLRKVMDEIEVAVFTFDAAHRLKLVNRAGERLLASGSEELLGRSAEELGLGECLEGSPVRTFEHSFAGGMGRWGLRRTGFREGGLPHQLLVLSDLSRALREEERQAWQRLIRVLGHELNNSLTPIKSMASTLRTLVRRSPPPEDWQEDMGRGLAIIAERSAALGRFMGAYSRLARLPQPELRSLAVADWVKRVSALERRVEVNVEPGAEVWIEADGPQLEQLLINLLRNAVDAALETGGGVTVGWEAGDVLQVWVRDEGPGLGNTSNLFVPFFTTKPGGSGIGLVLSRQIAEAHGGTLTLRNRQDRRGCEALLTLPVAGREASGGH